MRGRRRGLARDRRPCPARHAAARRCSSTVTASSSRMSVICAAGARSAWSPALRRMIRRAHGAGRAVVVVTNQSGIARGLYGWADLAAVQAEIVPAADGRGRALDAVLPAPSTPQGAETLSPPGPSRAQAQSRHAAMAAARRSASIWAGHGSSATGPGTSAAGRCAGLAGGLLPGRRLRTRKPGRRRRAPTRVLTSALIDRLDERRPPHRLVLLDRPPRRGLCRPDHWERDAMDLRPFL